MSYSQAYKRRVQELALARPDMTIPQILEVVQPEPGEPRANRTTLDKWAVEARGRSGYRVRYTPAMVDEAVRMVLAGSSLNVASMHIRKTYGVSGVTPDVIRRHLPAGFVYRTPDRVSMGHDISDQRWPNQIRAAAVEMVIGGGVTPGQARKRLIKLHGRAPSPATIARWAGVPVSRQAPKPAATKPEDAHLHLVNDDEPDSYERAWAAADGLDGAAWAEAVMRAWFGEDRCQASEPDVRVLTRRAAA